ncbi:ABC transporter permease subunit [Cytobacillus sp. FJAT-54145]|uniref:ABC transporter permease subunit n=1 Tax=Cytobacillus spartinae TaxID=3299023 RepID=A0ABW6KF63_9BACI
MVKQLVRSTLIFLLILLGFMLILLLPREQEIHVIDAFEIDVEYPFGIEVYKERIEQFITYFQEEKGFGISRTGVPISEEVNTFLGRSLKIIIPAFLISMILGTFVGILQFYYRNRKRGKFSAFVSWLFSSIPDFFLYIAIQFLLIKLIHAGLPHFNLYGHENWYSFIIPLLSLLLFPFIHMTRFTAASLENETGQEYLRTAYAKGLGNVKALVHMLWNCWPTILNQAQLVMLYILSSLPIIEKLSGFNGAGIQLLNSILNNDEVRALAFMLPFLFIMFATIIISQSIKAILVPKEMR